MKMILMKIPKKAMIQMQLIWN